jgi:hypothetical protein
VFKTQITTRLLVLVVLVDICAMIGCHRSYYRRQADAEASRLVEQKATDPRWDTPNGDISIDPMSRMFDPFSADHPPIPPDDPASHQFMHCVDEKPGYPHWHANGDTDYVANPDWKAYLPVNEKGQIVLDLDRAFRLALVHSPEYQQQRETLYQSALQVSLERFGFDSQLFAGFNSFYNVLGRFRNSDPLRPFNSTGGGIAPGPTTIDPGRSSSFSTSSLGVNGGGITLEKLGITGTNFVVGLANTILWNLGGANDYSADSLINFSVIQPLLRNAGRDVIMESLTQSERNLLANIRQLERFRRGFFLEVATGRNAGAGPSLGGAFTFLAIPASATTSIGGYYGLLLQQQSIRNQELEVRQLEAVLEQFREFFEAERLDPFQLKLFEANVYSAQNSLLQAKVTYQNQVDLFVRSLGLPPDLDVVINDDFLSKFEFISDQINNRLIEISDLRSDAGITLNSIDELLPTSVAEAEAANFGWTEELGSRLDSLKPYLQDAIDKLDAIKEEDIPHIQKDFDALDSIRDERVAYLEKLSRDIASGRVISDVDPLLYDSQSLPTGKSLSETIYDPNSERSIVNRISELNEKLGNLMRLLNSLESERANLTSRDLFRIISDLEDRVPGRLSDLDNILFELSLLQARARSNSVEIIDVDIDSGLATQVARCFRRDWMNARAALVDQWRQIEFVADRLESQFDLILEGDIGNVGDNPFKLRYETGQLRGGFRFDAPIVRLAERNQYVNALINYQQTRRRFYQFEDEIKRNLRQIIRNLDRAKVLFELNRRTVQNQIEQIELNRLSLEAPVGLNAGGGSGLGNSAARDLADGIRGLNREQTQYVRNWVEYEILRRSLDFDMGTMQLDELGFWIDPGQINSEIGYRAASAMGIELDCQFCDLTDYSALNTPVDQNEDTAPSAREKEELKESDNQDEAERPGTIEAPQPRIDAPQPPRAPNVNPRSAPQPAAPPENSYFRPVQPIKMSLNGAEKASVLEQYLDPDMQSLQKPLIRDLPALPSGKSNQIMTVSLETLLSTDPAGPTLQTEKREIGSSQTDPPPRSILWKSDFDAFGDRFNRFSPLNSPNGEKMQ